MSLDLNKLSNKLDEALSNETSETLTKFLNDKRMTNNKQQTPVEGLASELSNHLEMPHKYFIEILDQAKAMEKQMTIKLYADYENYLEEAFKNQCGGQAVILSFQEFYDLTYGGNK